MFRVKQEDRVHLVTGEAIPPMMTVPVLEEVLAVAVEVVAGEGAEGSLGEEAEPVVEVEGVERAEQLHVSL